MNDNYNTYRIWAPDNALWTQWAKPVLFARTLQQVPEKLVLPAVKWAPYGDGRTALFVDLPGKRGVLEGLALAQMGYRPVPLYNGVYGADKWSMAVDVTSVAETLYQGADRILVTSRPFMDYLHRVNGIAMDRMAYLPQHADLGMIDMDMQAEDNGVADFMFAGNIGKGQRADVIIKAAKVLGKRKDYRIHMLGDGRMREELEQMVRAEGLEENVIFYGNQKREDMPKFYKMADVLLVTLRGNNEVDDTIPGKMQMYMTTGKTIFGAINGGAQEVIRESRCGSCVSAGDYEGLAKLMQLYIEHPHDYDQCGENAREYFKVHFTLEHYMNGLETELQKVVDSKR